MNLLQTISKDFCQGVSKIEGVGKSYLGYLLPFAKGLLSWQKSRCLAVCKVKSLFKEKMMFAKPNKYIYRCLPNNIYIYIGDLAKVQNIKN
jgi:hypothetical protein